MKKLIRGDPYSNHKVVALLNREETDFLDKLGKDSLFSTGHKLSYNDILKTMVDFAMDAGLKGEDIGSPEILKAKILEQIKELSDKKLINIKEVHDETPEP